MADISELVKRMRGLAEYVDDCDEAADALEAQAKEIKIYQQTELTYVTRVADAQREYSEMQAKLKARIAELEAALDGLSEAFVEEMVSAGWIMRDIESVPAFRAALEGEK